MAVDIEYITDEYFAFDKPVPYELSAGKVIEIKPFMLTERKQFDQIKPFLILDKRDYKDFEDKEELQFIVEKILCNQMNIVMFAIVLSYLDYKVPFYGYIDGHYVVGNYNIIQSEDEDKEDVYELDEESIITSEEWEDIKRIMIYQNDPDYDDSFYYDATMRKNLEIEAKIRNKGIVAPNLERQFNIITAHCGLPKSEQVKLTLRSFKVLFNECIGEAEFFASYGVRMKYAEQGKPADHWIWQHKVTGLDKIGTEAKGFLGALGMDADEIFKDLNEQENNEGFKNEVTQDEIEEIRRKIAAGEM